MTEDAVTKLEPCPLCQSPHTNIARDLHGEPRQAFCKVCGCQAPIARWNTRAPSGAAVRRETLEEAASICDRRGSQFAALIAGGKGEHCKPGYARDNTWLSWMEKREMCRELSDRLRALAHPESEEKA